MKFIKFLPAVAATVVLAACSSTTEPVEQKVEPVVELPTTTKAVAYRCQGKKTLTATYTFSGEEVKSAVLKLGKKELGEFTRDTTASADFTTFVAGDYLWNADAGLTLSTFDKTEGSNLFKKGKNSDAIIAKDCRLNAKATAKLNQ